MKKLIILLLILSASSCMRHTRDYGVVTGFKQIDHMAPSISVDNDTTCLYVVEFKKIYWETELEIKIERPCGTLNVGDTLMLNKH